MCYNEPMIRMIPTGYSAFVRIFCGLAIASLPASGSPTGAQGTFVAGQMSPQSIIGDVVPFDYQNGLIVVKALVGDGLISSAILDTGLPLCIFSPEFASKRGIKASGTRDVLVLDRTVSVLNVAPMAVRINRVLVGSVPCGVLDLYSRLSSSPPADAPPVWIGNSALAALAFTIDPQTQHIQFRPPGAPMPIGSIVVPFEFKDGRIWVDVKVNGKKNFSALVDTGSVGTMLPAQVAKALSLTAAVTLPVTHPDGREGKVCAVELADIAMAGLKVQDVQAIYVEQGSKDGFDPDLGIIGNDVLLRYRVTIDYAQKKIAFEKIAGPKPDAISTAGLRSQPFTPAGARTVGPQNTKVSPAPIRPGG